MFERKTKIVATLGPSTTDIEKLEAVFKAGVNVFRLNFSHGTHEEHKKSFDKLRSLENKFKMPLSILADLQGPKLRIGKIENIFLTKGEVIKFDLNTASGNKNRIPLPHPEIFSALKTGSSILLDDGKICVKVLSNNGENISAEVIIGGTLSSKKGINIPDVLLPIPALTKKDRIDLDFVLQLGVDWVALSFVQTPKDVSEAKEIIKNKSGVMSKIEKPQAMEAINEIVQISDGIMIARGDLGVEIPPEEVPPAQKQIITLCRKYGKPVVVATQVLESMINTPIPTRAETSDIARAVYEGADAVMLSAETASGSYPVESVNIMHRVIKRVEQQRDNECVIPINEAIIESACLLCNKISVDKLIVFSEKLALLCSKYRPSADIICITNSELISRKLEMAYGVFPKLINNMPTSIESAYLITESEKKSNKPVLLVIELNNKINVCVVT